MVLSKLLASPCRVGWRGVGLGFGHLLGEPLPLVRLPAKKAPLVRHSGHMIPPSQYDWPLSKKFNLLHCTRVHWELIPVFVVTAISILLVILAFIWAIRNKVDAVFTTHSANNISRTMNLRQPTAHKVFIIYQRYDPWPEMQDVLDKMTVAEHRIYTKRLKCDGDDE